jgi:hypothetical protein
MGLLSMVQPQDGKFISAYWQKTKNDKEIASLVVADGEKKLIKCSYNTRIEAPTIGSFDVVTQGKVLDMCTKYDIKIQDWIFIDGKKYSVVDILQKTPFQESNMYLKDSVIWQLRILIK